MYPSPQPSPAPGRGSKKRRVRHTHQRKKMANLKDLRNRISSIKNTQKITRAMKMVAAAKVKRSENATKATRPFTNALKDMFKKLIAAHADYDTTHIKYEDNINNYQALLEEREVKTVGILVLTSNKGLAGAYNANLVRLTLQKIQEYNEKGIKCRVFVVGMKGIAALKRKSASLDFEIVKSYTKFPQEVTFSMSQVVAEDLADEYVEKTIDKVEIVTTTFRNMMSYSVESWQLLPVEVPEMEEHEHHIDPLMEFEPDADAVLQEIMPMYISNLIYQAFLEATASELASRMMAMSAATNNAEDMITRLTIDYNKVRQFAITQELIEIVSGASGLKK